MNNKARPFKYKGGARKVASRKRIDFEEIRRASLSHILPILRRFLPDGRIKGSQYYAHNPKRNDKTLGSFSVNVKNGKWADFATNEKGGDLISLCAYLFGLKQIEAAQRIAAILGISL